MLVPDLDGLLPVQALGHGVLVLLVVDLERAATMVINAIRVDVVLQVTLATLCAFALCFLAMFTLHNVVGRQAAVGASDNLDHLRQVAVVAVQDPQISLGAVAQQATGGPCRPEPRPQATPGAFDRLLGPGHQTNRYTALSGRTGVSQRQLLRAS